MEKTAVKKPTTGINKALTPPKVAKPSANELLSDFLARNKIVLMLDTLDKNVRTISDGGIIIGKPRISAEFR